MTFLLTACVLAAQAGLPSGSSKVDLDLGRAKIEVFTYKPADYQGGPILMVFHGVLRNADEYRDHARAMGDRFKMLIIAPKFDSTQFGAGMYQQGGLFRDGKVAARESWTWGLIPKVADQIRQIEGKPSLAYSLIGHSAGGQFLVRLAAFEPGQAQRIIAANPGSDLFPTLDMDYPYGFGKLPAELSDEAQLRKYLACPLTLYLGTADTIRDDDLDKSPGADRQGQTRLDRGRNAFDTAEALAAKHGWPFGWKKVEAEAIGHDHQAMFDHPACSRAVLGADRPASP